MAYYCNGKKGLCDTDGVCKHGCEHFDNTGGQRITTNADRIRAMSDKELCEFLSQYKFCDMCEEGCDSCKYDGDCDKRLLDWLKQPVEEDNKCHF